MQLKGEMRTPMYQAEHLKHSQRQETKYSKKTPSIDHHRQSKRKASKQIEIVLQRTKCQQNKEWILWIYLIKMTRKHRSLSMIHRIRISLKLIDIEYYYYLYSSFSSTAARGEAREEQKVEWKWAKKMPHCSYIVILSVWVNEWVRAYS